MKLKSAFLASLGSIAFITSAFAQNAPECGGDFASWRNNLVAEAQSDGVSGAGLAALKSAQIDPEVLKKDRAQGVFTLDFIAFSGRLIRKSRIEGGQKNLKKYAEVFARAQSEYGVPPEIITSFWAFETDYGAVQGDFNTLNAVTTLAHDCRRPELFRPQLIALAKLIDNGTVPADVTGA